MVATPEHPSTQSFKVIGTRPIRHDGYEKVTGRAVYGGDIRLPGMIWGEVLRSPYAHARIKSIDTTEAQKLPGVLATITHADLPAAEAKEIDAGEGVVNFRRASMNILAQDKVLYKGHMVAAVAAVDRNTASEAVKRIKVEYEPLKPVLSVDEATAPGTPILLEDLVGDHLGEKVQNTNIARHFRHEFGDPDAAFRQCSLVVDREFSLQMVHQGYIELHNATAMWEPDGRVTIWSSTQGSFGVRAQTAGILRLPESRIRVMPVEIGGGFGGKTVIYLPPIAAVLSKMTGRPVKMVMDRKSVFEGTGPAPGGKVRVKMGVDDQGKILASEVVIRFEAGAFPGSAVGAGGICVLAAYNILNTRIDGYDILVNKPKSAAYRAPGSPQVAFATEAVVDEICEKKGWDRIEFRLWNASHEGTRRADGPTFRKVGLIDCLQTARKSEHWNTPLEKRGLNGRLRGRGFATGYWMNGGGKSTCDLAVNNDGIVFMNEGSVDIGGTRASIAMQAAEALGIPAEDVRPSIPDTDSIGFTGVTGGSRTTYATGLAAYNAAMKLVDSLKERAAFIWERKVEDIDFKDGAFFSKSDPALSLTFKQLCAKLEGTGGSVTSTASVDLSTAGNSFALGICDLEVDPDTGKVDILRYTAIQDAGRAIHPAYVEGQMQGGAVQGIGWALYEEYFMTQQGVMANSSFLDYRMPTALDMPKIEAIIVEVPNPLHPYGVRGVAEVPLAPPLPAVANALHDALGIRFLEQPIKPARILEAISRNGS
ncbi:MAG: xanthine dehydrogenase family protein molybdopterin-binding subunit [Chloroflexi bacterium]|nr:xanthine dehydrogenase family protein molybdopterin-binding subunit [Chloroflexota bacterium]